MKAVSFILGLLVTHGVVAAESNLHSHSVRYTSTASTPPVYYMSIPVDHFDTSNKDTYKNRYYVNDTYYKPGGPVIIQDMGEQGFSPDSAGTYLAGVDGSMSSCMTLAEKLNGLVIGWEHRYYGLSLPVPYDDKTAMPVQGIEGYKYLTVQQAIEDVVYFANNFNQTDAKENNVIESTAGLDPYNAPWIFIGASYPGSRAAWIRLLHPEIIYASWSSSAPVETRWDASIYFDPIARALPKNCTNDFEAAVKYLDDTFTSGSQDAISEIQNVLFALKAGASGSSSGLSSDGSSSTTAEDVTAYDAGLGLLSLLQGMNQYQEWGAPTTTQIVCNYMQSFDVDTFAKNAAQASSMQDIVSILQNLKGITEYYDDGIAANYQNGDYYAFYAAVWALNELSPASSSSQVTRRSDKLDTPEDTRIPDQLSWTWQVLSEIGAFEGSNYTNNYQSYSVVSKFNNQSIVRDSQIKLLRGASESDFPALNGSWLESLGGWNMKSSNTMFTNGEFDPWRSLSVASQESHAGAPNRTITTTVPACNKVPSGDDVFGIVYDGAVHASDLVWFENIPGATENITMPMDDGVTLFLEAWDVWSKCFNQSRDDIRNGKGVDGSGNEANGTSLSSGKGSDKGDDKHNLASHTSGSMSSLLLIGLFFAAFFALM